jgi:tetratricopeptide (TPR) repeat protein
MEIRHWASNLKPLFVVSVLCGVFLSNALCACVSAVASAEEYYSIGMAYFDIGKYAEAEKWLNRAISTDKTKTASEYNLGRIAFENKRYTEALVHFERVLKRDPQNTLALKAAAYTHIKLGNIDKAEALYQKVQTLLPESADDGYNYALFLYVIEKYEESAAVLAGYPYALFENNDAILLGARVNKALHKPEAVDMYERSLEAKNDPLIRYEYAEVLEEGGFYARALEEYRATLKELPDNSENPSNLFLRYTIARLLLIADSESDEGITELEAAVTEGFKDTETLEKLLEDSAISDTHKDSIRRVIDGIKRTPQTETTEETAETEKAEKTEEEKAAEEAAAAAAEKQPGEEKQ